MGFSVNRSIVVVLGSPLDLIEQHGLTDAAQAGYQAIIADDCEVYRNIQQYTAVCDSIRYLPYKFVYLPVVPRGRALPSLLLVRLLRLLTTSFIFRVLLCLGGKPPLAYKWWPSGFARSAANRAPEPGKGG